MDYKNEKLQSLSRFLNALDSQAFTTDDFIKAFDTVIEFVKKSQDMLNERMTTMMTVIHTSLAEGKTMNASEMKAMHQAMQKAIEKDTEEMRSIKDYLSQKLETLDIPKKEDVAEYVLSQIQFPEQKELFLDTPIQVRDKLESIPDGEKLSIQAIQDLAKKLEELSKIAEGGTKGQKYGSIRTRYVDDETPSGTINGSNTDFTLSKIPATGSLKVYRGGARQRVTEDYTFSGRTITFTIAPQVGEVILCDYRY